MTIRITMIIIIFFSAITKVALAIVRLCVCGDCLFNLREPDQIFLLCFFFLSFFFFKLIVETFTPM